MFPFSNAIKIISYAYFEPAKKSFTVKLLSRCFIRANASAVALPFSALSRISASSPPSITLKLGRSAFGASCTAGFSNPSRVPRTLRNRMIKKIAMPANTKSSIIAGLISCLVSFLEIFNVSPYVGNNVG